MKVIPRRLFDRELLDELDINVSKRNNIIRRMSITHNQLSSEVFRKMIQHAWYASDHIAIHAVFFKTVAEVCSSFYAKYLLAMRLHLLVAAAATNHSVSKIHFSTITSIDFFSFVA